MRPGTLAALGRTAVGALRTAGHKRRRPHVNLLPTGRCLWTPGSRIHVADYRTWREQFISLDSRISSVSTDWQMGQPSPCRATLFNSRKLEAGRKREEFSSGEQTGRSLLDSGGLMSGSIRRNKDVIICNSDTLRAGSFAHFQPPSFSSSHSRRASSARETRLQTNAEDSVDPSETTVLIQMSEQLVLLSSLGKFPHESHAHRQQQQKREGIVSVRQHKFS